MICGVCYVIQLSIVSIGEHEKAISQECTTTTCSMKMMKRFTLSKDHNIRALSKTWNFHYCSVKVYLNVVET